MLKPRVHGTRVDQIGHRQLPNMPKALEDWMIDDLAFID
jgi:hypothetical protein